MADTDMSLGAAGSVDRAATTAGTAGRLVVAAFSGAILLGAGLIFFVEPMIAKMALPRYGGSPAVWNTSVVVFQALLLLGYTYAHVSTRLLGLSRQPLLHTALILLPLFLLPVGLPAALPDPGNPILALTRDLLLGVGAPFFVVTTVSPTLQRWFAEIDHPAAADPYFLYVASNVGSLATLLAYPFLIEPYLSLSRQARVWTVGYGLFVLLCVLCALLLRRYRRPSTPERAKPTAASPGGTLLAWRERFTWMLLAAIPSSLMLGATTFLTTDVAAIPLLWVLPLAAYLLSFIIAFSRYGPAGARVTTLLLPLLLVLALFTQAQEAASHVALSLSSHLAVLLTASILVHGRLAERRPAPVHLTEFYFWLSLGGVLGGMFNTLLAPLVFTSVIEYPAVLILALAVRRPLRIPWTLPRWARIPAVGVPAVAGLALLGVGRFTDTTGLMLPGAIVALLPVLVRLLPHPGRLALAIAVFLGTLHVATPSPLLVERTFFGVLRVVDEGNRRVLHHGTTVHGSQVLGPAHERAQPTTYYTVDGPIGQVFSDLQQDRPFREVAVVGLGAGSLAAYADDGQVYTFYEIDPAVVRIARDPALFTYLSDAKGEMRTVVGDGRLMLAEAEDKAFDLVVLDAFSSDAIPVHLLTREALQGYLQKLADGGVIALHISNRNIDLAPVVGALADDLGLAALVRHDFGVVDPQRTDDKAASSWAVMARDAADLAPLAADDRWRPLTGQPGGHVWTDDYSDIVSALRWFD